MALHFIAVTTPQWIDDQVREWKEFMRLNYGCKNALKSPAHITLVPPFTMNGDQEHSIKPLLADFAARQRCFPLVLHNFSAFPPRVIYVDVLHAPQLRSLQKQLETLLISDHYPVKPSNRAFHPHLTIANRDLKKDDFHAAFSHFSPMPYHAEFTACGLSLLTHKGAAWEIAFFTGFKEEDIS